MCLSTVRRFRSRRTRTKDETTFSYSNDLRLCNNVARNNKRNGSTFKIDFSVRHEKFFHSTLFFFFSFRLDSDQHARRTVQKHIRVIDPDYYRFETHVLFDDAFEDDEDGNRVPNRYVKQLVGAVNVAGASVSILKETFDRLKSSV